MTPKVQRRRPEGLADALTDAAEETGGVVEAIGYSGRAMYGRRCFALTGDGDDLFRAVTAAAASLGEAIEPPRRDSMGLGEVWYWQDVEAPAETDNDDEEDA